MTRARVAGGAIVAVLGLVALATGYRALQRPDGSAAPTSPAIPSSTAVPEAATPSLTPAAAEAQPGFLYGRVTTDGGTTYEGRLRWGRGEEAFWGDYFNGLKDENTWAAQVPVEKRPKERRAIKLFGIEIGQRERQVNLGRLFMARFGDITRVEASGRDVRVTLKSGTVFELDRYNASDFDDGVRVWDKSGVVDLGPRQIRSIELLPTLPLSGAPGRLHGAVRTRQGAFTGFVQWDREKCVGSDELVGSAADAELRLRFDTIRSIARRPPASSLVTQLDGREVVLSGTRAAGDGNRGLYVDDRRYGRVLVSWDAFERVDFSPGGSGPAYGDFPPGRPLTGSVATRDGRRLAGRLVYDLDESETVETLDAPAEGVDYTIPFGLIASIVLPGREESGAAARARVTLHSGEELRLALTGDLGERNAGMLIFVDGAQTPEYVRWSDIAEVSFDRPAAMYPPL